MTSTPGDKYLIQIYSRERPPKTSSTANGDFLSRLLANDQTKSHERKAKTPEVELINKVKVSPRFAKE